MEIMVLILLTIFEVVFPLSMRNLDYSSNLLTKKIIDFFLFNISIRNIVKKSSIFIVDSIIE